MPTDYALASASRRLPQNLEWLQCAWRAFGRNGFEPMALKTLPIKLRPRFGIYGAARDERILTMIEDMLRDHPKLLTFHMAAGAVALNLEPLKYAEELRERDRQAMLLGRMLGNVANQSLPSYRKGNA